MNTIGQARFDELLTSHDPVRGTRLLTLLDARIEGVSLIERDLSGCVLARCQLVGSQFFDSRFESCRMTGCNLRKAELNGSDLRGVDFTGSEMSRCDLTNADLRGANLTSCVLDWAWLIDCDLRDAVLERASFRGTRIGEAKLYNARRFALGPHDGARVDRVDLSPAGDGSVIVDGDDLWKTLSAP
jgi:uncharacterized protein YjbI with pentapeptide repeats